MGLTRHPVQRVADRLIERGLADYVPNPNHRRANLLACTEAGYWAIRRIALAQHPWANTIGAKIGAKNLRHALTTMQRVLSTVESNASESPKNSWNGRGTGTLTRSRTLCASPFQPYANGSANPG